MVKIITDSTSDLSDELLEKYDIDMLPLYIHMGENEYKDRVQVSVEDIYDWSDANNATPKTAAPSIQDVVDVIEPYINQKRDVIIFSVSEDMSSTAQVMRMAAQTIESDEHVFVIDSKNLSTGIGLLVIEAAILAKENLPAKEIVERINELIPRVRASFVVDTLKYLHRGGRCSATAALAGGMLKLKPRIHVEDGKMDAGKKYRGSMQKVLVQYVKEMEEELKNAKKDRVFITHSMCSEEIILQIKEYLEGLNHFDEILITSAGGVISSHCGPGTLGVLFIEGGKDYDVK